MSNCAASNWQACAHSSNTSHSCGPPRCSLIDQEIHFSTRGRTRACRYVGPAPIITGIGALLTSLIALTPTLLAVRKSNAQFAANTSKAIEATATTAQNAVNQKATELEIAAIEQRLSGFFGPFMKLSAENKRLAELLRTRQPTPDFRTLRALLDFRMEAQYDRKPAAR